MELENFILQQIQYLASPESDLPKSIAVFGVTPERFKSLFKTSETHFNKIKSILEKNRKQELNKLQEENSKLNHPMQEERNEIADKYENLVTNYKNRPELLEEILEWKFEALLPFEKHAANRRNGVNYLSTPLKERVENFQLTDFNLREFYQIRKRMVEIRDEYGIVDERSLKNAPAEIREEYNDVAYKNQKLLISNYVFVHELNNLDNDDPLSLEYILLNNGLGFIKWCVVFFEQNYKDWFNQASDELKEIVKNNFIIFEN